MARAGRIATLLVTSVALAGSSAAGGSHAASARTIATVDLSAAFRTRSPWRFTAEQGPDVADPIIGEDADKVPGAIALCIARASGTCAPDLMALLRHGEAGSDFVDPHYLEAARIVRSRTASDQPLLLVRAASLHSMNGNQAVATQVLAYDRVVDSFKIVYARIVGRNNNEEVRYFERGPLAGLIVSAEPTGDAPFGYWVTVSRRTRPLAFTQVLRFRSATRYADGNDLKVIDSEATNIARRLGLWRPGMKPLLPAAGCASPRLRGMALWCTSVAPRAASD